MRGACHSGRGSAGRGRSLGSGSCSLPTPPASTVTSRSNGLELGERPAPEARPGWTTVNVRAASLNHHDLWSLRGVGLAEDKLPMILGCDAAGHRRGRQRGRPALRHRRRPATGSARRSRRSILTERYQGTFAEQVTVPTWNVLPKPKELSFEEAACLPTAWLTAYRMLFTNAGVRPGDSVLVQGAGGGVATAAIVARQGGRAAGLRHQPGRGQAQAGRGAGRRGGAFEPGARLPQRVDAVIETVGAATWSHSVKSLQARRHAGHLRRHERRPPLARRTDPDLLPGAEGRRLHDGHARTSWRTCSRSARPRASGRSSTRCCRWTGPARASRRWRRATSSARSS